MGDTSRGIRWIPIDYSLGVSIFMRPGGVPRVLRGI